MNTLSNQVLITIPEMKECIKHAGRLKQSIIAVSGPGLGKTEGVYQTAKELHDQDPSFHDKPVEIYIPTMDLVNLTGLPKYIEIDGKSYTEWSLPKAFIFDKDFKGIIYFDEFNQASKSVINATFNIILNHKVGDLPLPEGAIIVATMNPAQFNASVNQLPAPLKNRFTYLYIRKDLDAWIDWAMKNNINKDVITFLATNKRELLVDEKALENDEDTVATPRAWSVVSTYLNDPELKKPENKQYLKTLISGRIGLVNTQHLFNFIEDKDKFQDPKQILIDGQPFTSTDIDGFYGTFISAYSMLLELDKPQRKQACHNICTALTKLKNKEWIAFGCKWLVENKDINECIDGKDLITIGEHIE